MAAQLGVLLASGLIVGESLAGVAMSALIVATSQATPLQPPFITDAFANPSMLIGVVAFAAVTWVLYAWLRRMAVDSAAPLAGGATRSSP